MKKFLIILFTSVIILSALTACGNTSPADDTAKSDYSTDIAALESQIAQLQSNYSVSDSESKKRLEELTALLNSLKETSAVTQDTTDADTVQGFQYTLEGGLATITGYTGTEQNLVIPASIDGHRVVAIGESAFAELPIKSVIISTGVEEIGWFAFDGCTKLSAITVPSSVKSIGYCALGTAESSLTVYCHQGSFALEYAKSYGLTYAII